MDPTVSSVDPWNVPTRTIKSDTLPRSLLSVVTFLGPVGPVGDDHNDNAFVERSDSVLCVCVFIVIIRNNSTLRSSGRCLARKTAMFSRIFKHAVRAPPPTILVGGGK